MGGWSKAVDWYESVKWKEVFKGKHEKLEDPD